MSARDVRLPSNARFTCQGCGRCCTMWAVTVSEKKVETLRKHDWGAEPFKKNPGPGEAYQIRMIDGRCFFLDEQRRCRIHLELGYDAKPDGCKAFPLHLSQVSGNTYGRLSFYCPTVSENSGKKLGEQQRWIKETLRAVGAPARQTPLTLAGEHELTARELDAILDQLIARIETPETPLDQRLAAAVAVLQRLCTAVEQRGKPAFSQALRDSSDATVADLANEACDGGRVAKGTTVLSLFLGQDAPPRKVSRLLHFVGVRLSNLRLVALRSHVLKAKARQGKLRAIPFAPPADANALLERFFVDKLRARRCLDNDFSLMQGLNLLIIAYGVINLLARLHAAANKRAQCSEEDVRLAVQAADLLVVEHTTLFGSTLFDNLVRSILTEQKLAGSIMAAVGCSAP